MCFGFSYIGLIWLIMLFVPNYIWTKNKPQAYEEYSHNENKVLLDYSGRSAHALKRVQRMGIAV